MKGALSLHWAMPSGIIDVRPLRQLMAVCVRPSKATLCQAAEAARQRLGVDFRPFEGPLRLPLGIDRLR